MWLRYVMISDIFINVRCFMFLWGVIGFGRNGHCHFEGSGNHSFKVEKRSKDIGRGEAFGYS